MLPFRQILFPVDFSEPCRLMAPSVRRLAKHFRCPVTLFHSFELPFAFYGDVAPMDFVVPEDLQSAHESKLRTFAAENFEGDPHEQIVMSGEPSRAIRCFVQRNGADLIMMPTSGHGPLRRMLLGSTVAKVLHDVPCPVWTSAHENEGDGTRWPVRSILCALSLEDESVAIAKAAASLAASLRARLTLMHAAGYPHAAIEVDYEFYRKQRIEDATQQLQSLRWDNGIEATAVVVDGSVLQTVRDQAEAAHADLVVVGRGHAQGAVSRLWSDLYDVIRESPVPVLSI